MSTLKPNYGTPVVRRSYYLRKSARAQRDIIRKPWRLPMAAQNLAAITIQKHFRRLLALRRAEKLLRSPRKIRRQLLEEAERGKIRKHGDSTVTQKLRAKFLTSEYNNPMTDEEDNLRQFCAALIQATFKMMLERRRFKWQRFAMYHVAAIQIQWAWKAKQKFFKKEKKVNRTEEAALTIQKFWRSYTNVRVYRYYRDLINFKEKGNPMQLLKSINPTEASYLDGASNIHIRFRLGGDKFPPMIYYKVYCHGSICDVNSYAPRDYAKGQIEQQKSRVTKITLGLGDIPDNDPLKEPHGGWYTRDDHNGWRPISDKIITPYDAVELETKSKKVEYHSNKYKRKELSQRQKRLQKLRWLKKLYRDAKYAESQDGAEEDDDQSQADSENPLEHEAFEFMDSEEFDHQVSDLLEWSEGLDFEKYQDNWGKLATSAKSEIFTPNMVLGEMSNPFFELHGQGNPEIAP